MNKLQCPVCKHEILLDGEISWEGWHLDKTSGRLTAAGLSAQLRSRENDLMELLILARGKVLPFDRAAALIWSIHPPAYPDATLRVLMSRLRKSLGDHQSHIVTIYKFGYRLKPVGAP